MELVRVGVLGASSLVADSLLPLLREVYAVVPFSRRTISPQDGDGDAPMNIPNWISLLPIWVLPDYFPKLAAHGARRLVVLSTTSVFTKKESPDPADQVFARRLMESEQCLITWAEGQNVEWLILRPTLIYGRARDGNISEIARFIRRFGFFPILGAAKGLRQPIHAEDVSSACRCALEAKRLANCSYNISGRETLSYREMVGRVFDTLEKRRRFVRVPLWTFRGALGCARLLPRYRHLNLAMAQRMNEDMILDNSPAARDFGFSPREFRLNILDISTV